VPEEGVFVSVEGTVLVEEEEAIKEADFFIGMGPRVDVNLSSILILI